MQKYFSVLRVDTTPRYLVIAFLVAWLYAQHSLLKPVKLSRCIKASFYITVNRLDFLTKKYFMMKISLKLSYQCMEIFFNFSHTSNYFHPLQVENCPSNSRLVADKMTMINSGSKGLIGRYNFNMNCLIKYIVNYWQVLHRSSYACK